MVFVDSSEIGSDVCCFVVRGTTFVGQPLMIQRIELMLNLSARVGGGRSSIANFWAFGTLSDRTVRFCARQCHCVAAVAMTDLARLPVIPQCHQPGTAADIITTQLRRDTDDLR